MAEYPDAVAVSALRRSGIPELLATIDRKLRHHMPRIDVLVPYQRGDLVALMHEHGVVEREEHTEEGTRLVGRLPTSLVGRYSPYWTGSGAAG